MRRIHMMAAPLAALGLLAAWVWEWSARADEKPAAGTLTRALALRVGPRGGRSALHTDAVEALIVAGKLPRPSAGATFDGMEGKAKWEPARAGADGLFSLRGAGYTYIPVESEADKVMMLEASGHGMVYVNGEPRAGDPYQNGWARLPILLKKGTNDLLFSGGRGRLRAKLVPPKAAVFVDTVDPTLPDILTGEERELLAGVMVVNASTQPLEGAKVLASVRGGPQLDSPIPMMPPLSTRKVVTCFHAPDSDKPGEVKLEVGLQLKGGPEKPTNIAEFNLRVRRPEQEYRRTFSSDIDGSLQYYAVTPMQGPGPKEGPALVLTLHGAGVEAQGQADAYDGKDWCHIVAATNRRPFGFDWEDWGRLDAIEVLEHVQKELKTDPARTYLTGHSMGGHGAWHVGVTFPDRFAAIAPSAGWVSFWSYAGGRRVQNPTPVEELLQRATNASDTLGLARNYAQQGVYVLHGDADDNVPVGQARTMRQALAAFHPNFVYYERPGAGHWWGNACVDWPPLFQFLKLHRLPPREQIGKVEFVTANPGVSASCHWARIEMQVHPWKFSSVKLSQDVQKASFKGTTDNVELLSLDLSHLKSGETLNVELDGQKLEGLQWPADSRRLLLKRDLGKTWFQVPTAKPGSKTPQRAGGFKDAFRNQMRFVYGTQGTPEENAWSLARARYDAETFWYRGNGSVDIVADTAFDPKAFPDRNVILYGNAETNGAWKLLLADSPVQVQRRTVRIGEKEFTGDNLACLCIRPRSDSATASVGVVAGTGLAGMRLTERMPYFISGTGYPDCLVIGPEMLTEGAKGVRVAGYFGNDWGVATGDFAGLK